MDGEIAATSAWTLSGPIEQSLTRDHRQKVAARKCTVTFAFSFAALLATLQAHNLVQTSGLVPLLFLGATLLSGFLSLRYSGRVTDLAFYRQQALIEEFGGVGGWIVEITLYQGGAVTGKDEGVVWFENGRLYFSDYRTSFGLGPDDVASGIKQRKPIDGIQSPLSLELKRSTAAGKVSIGFSTVPSEPSKHSPAFVLERLTMTARQWLEQPAGIVGQGPPLSVGPGAPSLSRLLGRALVATGFWGLVAATIVVFQTSHWPVFLLFPFLVPITAFCSEVWYPIRRWRIWHARKRLGDKT